MGGGWGWRQEGRDVTQADWRRFIDDGTAALEAFLIERLTGTV